MTKWERMRGRPRSVVLASSIAAALVVVAASLSACGGGGSSTVAEATHCEVGNPPLLEHHRRIPAWVEERHEGTPPVIVGCIKDPKVREAEVVGFGNTGPATCVTVDAMKQREVHGELCTPAEQAWVEWCKGASGCIENYIHAHGFTEFSGPVDARVEAVKITVDGKPAKGSVTLVHIPLSLGKRIQAVEPFGFFVAFLNGCVRARQLRISLVGPNGSSMGTARGWHAPEGACQPA